MRGMKSSTHSAEKGRSMRRRSYFHCVATLICLLVSIGATAEARAPTPEQLEAIQRAGLEADQIVPLLDKPLYQFTEAEVGLYLKYAQVAEPDLRKRIVHLARKNIGQPYELYLLGEMPFETYDPQPIYCLGKSDCVVFSEHTYAMALSGDWADFMSLLQRIRYRDGHIGVATRNHYTEADWNPSNRWLVHDITADLAGDKGVSFEEKIDRAAFLKKRYGLKVEIPTEVLRDVYLPYSEIARAKSQLRDGDFVNVVRGIVKPGAKLDETFSGSAWVGHVGLIAHGDDGTVHMIHSTEPKVREEPIDTYIARSTADVEKKDAAGKQRLLGFKFLRLEENPLENLRKIDGDQSPRVTLPRGEAAKF